ncbi:MAG: outer membrane beta-barrel protein [Kangiellaceae bacterium]|jgi:uncharacterized protein YgiM (DUF1202 family)|nr:outer membrane beta-barrel protein [Kangiellaceae bacterium]
MLFKKATILLTLAIIANASDAADTESTDVNAYNSAENKLLVTAPFINIQTGPGGGYPVFYIAEKNEKIAILKRKFNWFKIANSTGKIGWITLESIKQTKNLDGSPVSFQEYTEQDFIDRNWELGFRSGDFGGGNLVGINAGWHFTENLAVELNLGETLGDFSKIQQVSVSVTNSPFVDWPVSPYFGIGGGIINVEPNAALVQEVDRQDEVVFGVFGIKSYITERFIFRAEYRSYVILTTQETNEDIEEWSIGFSVFF